MNTNALPMNPPSPTPAGFSGDAAQDRVIAANRCFHNQIAQNYDQHESCAFQPYWQRAFEQDLETIASHIGSSGRTLQCLDCGGGTGNLALKMLARRWSVTVVDASEKMLAVLEQKTRAAGHSPRLVHSSIERFLEETSVRFDVVAFSSVLHHLYDYRSVVQQAAAALRPGGIFYSSHDPVVPKQAALTRAFNTLDIAVGKLMFDPADILPGIGRRFRKLLSPADSSFQRTLLTDGDLAEYHAVTGVDDAEIIRVLQRHGCSMVQYLRYPAGRTLALHSLNQRLRLLENFKIIAQRSGISDNKKERGS
jgi:2-polyprenyl-3-methyl-5-hydroxy-6-metoxy-1,4-benzoquinol methylase